jgi:hypothetical protein
MSNQKPLSKKKKLEKEEVISLAEMFAQLMNAYGDFAESLGKIQKAHAEAYEDIFSLETIEKFPEMLTKVIEEEPPEISRLVIGIFSKMTAALPRIAKIMELPADDKIKLGENLKSLAKDFKKLLEWAEKRKE